MWSHIQRLLSVQFLYFQFKSQCPLRNVSVRKQAVCARALSVLKPLAHDSILFHPTSSSSLKHKRKDERKHKKRSVCDCCIGIMYSPKPTQLLFDPPSTFSPSARGISPSSPFQSIHCRGRKERGSSKMLSCKGRMGECRNVQLLFLRAEREKSLVKRKTDWKLEPQREGRKKGWERVRETNFMLWSFNIFIIRLWTGEPLFVSTETKFSRCLLGQKPLLPGSVQLLLLLFSSCLCISFKLSPSSVRSPIFQTWVMYIGGGNRHLKRKKLFKLYIPEFLVIYVYVVIYNWCFKYWTVQLRKQELNICHSQNAWICITQLQTFKLCAVQVQFVSHVKVRVDFKLKEEMWNWSTPPPAFCCGI